MSAYLCIANSARYMQTNTHLIIHRPSRTWLHLYIRLWPKNFNKTNDFFPPSPMFLGGLSALILRHACSLLTFKGMLLCICLSYVHACLCMKILNLLLETLVVTAVTEAREMVSGSSDPASRMAFLSRSSMSRMAGSSGHQLNQHTLLALRWVQ